MGRTSLRMRLVPPVRNMRVIASRTGVQPADYSLVDRWRAAER